jgi:hypothetical protein
VSEEHAPASDETPGPGKKPRPMDTVVMREIRRARKLFRDEETVAEANFVVAAANVLALVDLAAAIRETNPGSGEEEQS